MDVFHKASGIFVIYTDHYTAEDMENPDIAEGVGHYIVYNAGTRVLFLNPEVIVLDEEDFANIFFFLKKIERAPYLLRIPGVYPVNRYAHKLCYYVPRDGPSADVGLELLSLPHA